MSYKFTADRFVAARRTATALPDYPGDLPVTMADAYAIQDAAIDQWHQRLVGWKIARIHPDFQAQHGERMAGPIFANSFREYQGETLTYPLFTGGFGAVEAEFVLRIDHDADPEKTSYTEEEALRLCDGLYAGVEVAGSPFPKINELGPTVTASDFGNNFGEILGPRLLEIDSDTTLDTVAPERLKYYKSKTEIDGQIVGEGGLFVMPGGPFKALAWLAGHLAQRGRPLTRGLLISTGQTTGVHAIKAGQTSVITFSGIADVVIRLKTVSLTAGAPEILQETT